MNLFTHGQVVVIADANVVLWIALLYGFAFGHGSMWDWK